MYDVFTSNTSSNLESMVMKKRRKTALGEDVAPLQQRRLLSGPLVFLFMVFVVTVGSIECISTVRNYALSL